MAFFVLLLIGCTTVPGTRRCKAGLALVHASAWFATAAEYRADAVLIYAAARVLLDQALVAGINWAAARSEEFPTYLHL